MAKKISFDGVTVQQAFDEAKKQLKGQKPLKVAERRYGDVSILRLKGINITFYVPHSLRSKDAKAVFNEMREDILRPADYGKADYRVEHEESVDV